MKIGHFIITSNKTASLLLLLHWHSLTSVFKCPFFHILKDSNTFEPTSLDNLLQEGL